MGSISKEQLVNLLAEGKLCSKEKAQRDFQLLTAYHKKVTAAIAYNIEAMVEKYGIENLVFLTLTFRDHVTCAKEAERRFHSLERNELAAKNGRYLAWLGMLERHKSGRIHYHVLLACRENMRGEINFAEIEAEDYRSANAALRAEWAFWRKKGPAYRFGRTEALPVRTCAYAMARYVSKYISKHIDRRHEDDLGVRLWKCSAELRKMSVRFMWESKRTRVWRAAVGRFAAEHDCKTPEAIARKFGPRWAYYLGPHIMERYGNPDGWEAPLVVGPEDPVFEEAMWDPEVPSPKSVARLPAGVSAEEHEARVNDPVWREMRLRVLREPIAKWEANV